MENRMFGLSANNVDYKQQEAFRLYKIFNSTFIEMRYNLGLN